nr:MAG TPA: hypothetical protein [Caudoviricetes sp.]
MPKTTNLILLKAMDSVITSSVVAFTHCRGIVTKQEK